MENTKGEMCVKKERRRRKEGETLESFLIWIYQGNLHKLPFYPVQWKEEKKSISNDDKMEKKTPNISPTRVSFFPSNYVKNGA